MNNVGWAYVSLVLHRNPNISALLGLHDFFLFFLLTIVCSIVVETGYVQPFNIKFTAC